MRRRALVDAVLLVSLLAAWAACTTLHVRQVATGRLAWVGVYATWPAADGLPAVRGFWPGAPAAATGRLAVGDRLLAAGGADLRGVTPFGFFARVHGAAIGADLRAPIRYERAGVTRDASIALIPVAFPWRLLPLTCAMVATAALVLVRRRGTRIARAFFLVAIAYGLHWTFFFGGSALESRVWAVVFLGASLVILPLALRAALVFPPEIAPEDGRLPWWPWLFAVFGPVSSSWVFGVPLPPELAFRAVFAVNAVFIATLLAVLTRNYLRAGPVGRRQLKWVVLGIWVGTLPVLLADVVGAVVPSLWWLHDVAMIAEVAIPLSILIAIVRTNLFDVDRLITGAAVYSVLSVLALAGVLAAVPWLARHASHAMHVSPATVQALLSLVVAAGIVPGHRFLHPRIERLLFRERHALRAGVEELLRDLGAASGPEALLTMLGERLEALVRPQACAIYAPLGDDLAPVFERGGQPLVAEVVLPLRRGAELAASLCLGAKRSGDVYTDTDQTLLAAVADKVSSELLRFDAALILEQERHMRETLRRYVPGSIAERLAQGKSIEGGERDVSVLFVDIRGYTAFSETQAAGDVFSMLNRYTEAVSAVIQRRGGTVVEFLGDGLMAVFGAPDPLPEHARVAVEAACEVVGAVHRLALDAAEGGAPMAVGVGVASGEAFVGNIRTSDRLVFTAVGDVVNLASRIQALTRELHAAVAIDARTHRRAGGLASRFQRHAGIRIRGRAEPADVYALAAVA